MTGTLRSLCDWLADQVAEVRHLSPLAVLVPAKSTPVAVPALDDMPSTESVPACEHMTRRCDGPATKRVRAHVDTHRRAAHGDMTVLMCDPCLVNLRVQVDRVIRDVSMRSTTTCWASGCTKQITCAHDLIMWVMPL